MKYIVDILTLLMLMFSFVACSSDDDVAVSPVGDDGKVTVRLILALGNEEAGTTRVASTPIDEMRDGTIAENWINDVQILVYDKEGTTFIERATIETSPYMLTATELNEKGIDPTKEGVYYGIEGTLYDLPYQSLVNGEAFQFVVLCNLGDKDQATDAALYTAHGYGSGIGTTEFLPAIDGHSPAVTGTVDRTIANLAYRGYTSGFTAKMLATGTDNKPTEAARIPMWGFLKTTIQDNGSYTVNVLRSMAKVRVALGTSVTGYNLKGVTLTRANSAGYFAAQDIPAADAGSSVTRQAINGTGTNWNYKDGSTTTIGITNPSPLVDDASAVLTNLPFVGVDAEGKPVASGTTPAAYVIYVPEYDNMSTSATPATISLTITDANNNPVKDANDNDHQLFFADYGTTEKPTSNEWDIIRNDFFDYTITSITPTGGLKANVRVMPWEYEKMGYELTQNPVVTIGWSDEWPVCYDGINYGVPTCYEEPNYGATFYVDVSIPEGVKWQAHLTNRIDFEFDLTNGYSDRGYAAINPIVDTENNNPNDYYGNEVYRVTVKVRPKSSFKEGVRRTTNLYFTLETLVGDNKKATIKWWADDPATPGYYKTTTDSDGNTVTTLEGIEGNGLFPMLGDTDDPPGKGKMVRIVQIAESEWEGYRYSLLDEWKEEQYEAQQAATAEGGE